MDSMFFLLFTIFKKALMKILLLLEIKLEESLDHK